MLADRFAASTFEDQKADVCGAWGDARDFEAGTIRAIPLFAELDDRSLDLLLRSAREVEVPTGTEVIRRWQGTRQFYVVLSGSLEARRDKEVLDKLGPGDFFGEAAALDWGAGFGYARTASVIAASEARLVMIPPATLQELMRIAPSVREAVSARAAKRLQRI